MSKFKVGDKVRFIPLGGRHSAKSGATAVVTEAEYVGMYGGPYVRIEWDRDNGLCGTQSDGGYFPEDFEKIEAPLQFQVGDMVKVVTAHEGTFSEWTVGLVGVVKAVEKRRDDSTPYLLWFPYYVGVEGHSGLTNVDRCVDRCDHWWVSADVVEKHEVKEGQTVRITGAGNVGQSGIVLRNDGEGEGRLPWWVRVGEGAGDDVYSFGQDEWRMGSPYDAEHLQPTWGFPEDQMAVEALPDTGSRGGGAFDFDTESVCDCPLCAPRIVCNPAPMPEPSTLYAVVDADEGEIVASYDTYEEAADHARTEAGNRGSYDVLKLVAEFRGAVTVTEKVYS